MLKFLREQLAKLLEQRAALAAERDQIIAGVEARGATDLTPDEEQAFEERRAAITALDADIDQRNARIAELEGDEKRDQEFRSAQAKAGTLPEARGRGGAKVTHEQRTYTPEANRTGHASFFVDAWRSQFSGDYGAQQRVQRHLQEVAVEGEGESRATTTTSFAGLVVPQYLVDEAALLLRAGRPTANIVNRMPLPAQGMSVIIPRGTTGASAASQATENSALSSTDEVWANLTVPVVTIGGQQDVSRQSIERGEIALDSLIYMDLVKAYNAELDRQVLNGSGASGQALGILQTSNIGKQSVAYGATVTPSAFYLKSAGALATIAAAGTAIVPGIWIMHPRRWYWLSAQVDSQGRPLVVPNQNGVFNTMAVNTLPGGYSGDGGDASAHVVGIYQGLPVILDASIPTNLGFATNEDPVIAMDASQAYLWEDNGGVPRQMRFEQTLPGQLTIKLVAFNYAAFTAGRYPVAFYQVGGVEIAGTVNGQSPPSF